MNIAIVGYGKMGRLIEKTALARGHAVAAVVDPFAAADVNRTAAGGQAVVKTVADAHGPVDVAIEFSSPASAVDNIKALLAAGFPVVTGTTGWYDRLPEVEAAVKAADGALLWSSNYAIGVRLFLKIAAYAAKITDMYTEYDIAGYESHHNKKADSPSGTAKTLVEKVLAAQSRKTRAVYDKLDRPPAGDELHFASLRTGSDPGTHALFFDSDADTIEIKHRARNRDGLALGAVRAAEWLAAAPRHGVFTLDDML
ncbi:MAG: 4-hydroxy-tetrahydrodipicolinate reductase [Spirochaetaceae bacterium]|jgi:4-hydroxy-tetrahydrodipicolinate reductase|nr:4-hydroxy-tetrahydrodipicolinate reductase [Spirochaetaceae bacterium]